MIEIFTKHIGNIWFVCAAALIFIPLENLFPRHKEQKQLRKYLFMDLMYTLLGGLLTMFVAIVFILFAVTMLQGLVPSVVKSFVHSLPIWLQVIVLIICGDLYYYWAHRAFHMVPFLWRFHAIHHSVEDMDWVAAHRTHPIDTGLTNSGFVIVTLLFNIHPAALAIHSLQFAWHSLLKHSNVNVSWGPLRWLYVTPTFHHWHHGNTREAWDKNFAAQFPIWDILFGTAIMKESENPEKYGVDDPVPYNFIGQLAYPFQRSDDAAATTGQQPEQTAG